MTETPRSQLSLLKSHGIRPVKRRGQNFLLDGNLARAIAADVLALSPRVLELGAGGGALTGPLLEKAEKVVCVEIDRHLCGVLQAEFGALPAFTLVEGDLARLDWDATLALAGERPVVAGNLPYVLTSTVLFALAGLRDRITGGVFMVQKEVAERMTARPGGRDYGVLSILLGSIFAIDTLRPVPRDVFWPRPDVASAVVRLVPAQRWTDLEFAGFTAVVRGAFEQRRKKLRSVLRARFGYDHSVAEDLAARAGIDPDLRPEQITPPQWRKLATLVSPEGCK